MNAITNTSYIKQVVDIDKLLLKGHEQGDDLNPDYK